MGWPIIGLTVIAGAPSIASSGLDGLAVGVAAAVVGAVFDTPPGAAAACGAGVAAGVLAGWAACPAAPPRLASASPAAIANPLIPILRIVILDPGL